MNFLLKPLAIATLSIAMLAPAKAETYIKTQSGHVWPKHECTSTPCVDCTFLTYEACYAKAKQAGVTDERPIGFGPGQRVPMRIDPRTGVPLALEEIPLERECNRWQGENNTTSYFLPGNKGQIICPVLGAVEVPAPVQPKRVAEPWLPDESPGGEAAVGIFFAQFCPGYVTEAARQLIHTVSQFRAREASEPYNNIKTKLAEAASANQTSVQEELYKWCIAAEPRIAAIQDKLGQVLK